MMTCSKASCGAESELAARVCYTVVIQTHTCYLKHNPLGFQNSNFRVHCRIEVSVHLHVM